MLEIKKNFEKIANSWENFKQINDQKEQEIETKGSVDPIRIAQLENLEQLLDGYQKHITKLETALSRPTLQQKPNRMSQDESENNIYDKSFIEYLRNGSENNILHLERKSTGLGSRVDSGYAVTTKIQQEVNSAITNLCPIRQIASCLEISSDTFEILKNEEEVFAGWSEEALDTIEKLPPIQFQKHIIPIHEIYAQPKSTQKLLDDPRIDVEKWLSDKLVEAFAIRENEAFLSGDGKGKPQGLFNNKHIPIIDGQISVETLLRLYYDLPEKFIANSIFLVGRETIQQLRMLKDTNSNRYLWQPSLSFGVPDTLLGSKVTVSNNMVKPEKDSLALAFGDFNKGYQIIDRQGIHVLRDPFTHKPFVKFYATKRVGGSVLNPNALRLLKLL